MVKLNVINNTSMGCVGVDLLKKIYAKAYNLDATTVIINKARYNKWAEVELYENGNAIDWHYNINV